MPEQDKLHLGQLIQAYVQACWGDRPDAGTADELGMRLGPELKERIDILGLDSEHLLQAQAIEALRQLARLEQAAAQEDARVAVAAGRQHALEVKKYDATNPTWRRPDLHHGRHREPAGHRRHRQRGTR